LERVELRKRPVDELSRLNAQLLVADGKLNMYLVREFSILSSHELYGSTIPSAHTIHFCLLLAFAASTIS
jgi:hypothetical protein